MFSDPFLFGLVAVYLGDNSTLRSLAVSPFGCNELTFLANDFLCACEVAFSLYEGLLAVHHSGAGHLTKFCYVSCFNIHFRINFKDYYF